MATISEMLVSIKVQLEQSTLGRAINNIQNQVQSIKNPTVTPHVNTSPALQALRNIRQSFNETRLELKTNFQNEIGKKFATGVSGTETAAIGAGLGYAVKQAIDFEDHMIGISKQVKGARDDAGNLTPVYKEMYDQVQELSKVSPISANEIADIVSAGARMDVAKEDLMDFTKLSIKMATAFEAPAGEIADQMGKIGNVFKIPVKNIGELAGAINYLDDNAISKGSDIINVLQRVGGSANTVGLSANNVAALGSTFLSMGKAPEVAATSINSMITTLSTLDASKVGKAGDDFAKLGLTTSQVQKMMGEDAQKTIELVLSKLGELPKQQRILAATNIFGKQFGDDIITIAGNMDEYHRQLKLANSETAKASLNKEYEARLKSTSAQLEMFKNKLTVLAVNVGSVAIPAMLKLADAIAPIIEAITNFAKENPILISTLFGIVGAMVAVKVAGLALMFGVGTLGSMFKVVQGVMLGFQVVMATMKVAWLVMTGQTTLATMALGGWGVASKVASVLTMGLAAATKVARLAMLAFQAVTPMGWIVLGINLVIAALLYMATNWDKVKAVAKAALDGIIGAVKFVAGAIIGAFKAAIDGVIGMFTALFDKAKAVWSGIKSIFNGKIEANPNIQATLNATRAREGNYGTQLPQAVLNNHYNTVANKQNSASTVNNNQKVTVNVAPNSSANQAKEITNAIQQAGRSQNKSSLAYAGSGYR